MVVVCKDKFQMPKRGKCALLVRVLINAPKVSKDSLKLMLRKASLGRN